MVWKGRDQLPRYDLILIDADDTLLDFEQSQRFALFSMLGEIDVHADEDILDVYDKINAGYWRKLERGEISKQALIVRRFDDLLTHLGVLGDSKVMNERFIHYFAQTNFLIPHALETLAALSPHCTIAIATNGIAFSQRKRIGSSPIAPHISYLITSEEAEAAKPDTRFYDYAFSVCGNFDKSRTLMVGDSLTADMLGGMNYGIDTCWYNPNGLTAPPEFEITYTISALDELVNILLQDDRKVK